MGASVLSRYFLHLPRRSRREAWAGTTKCPRCGVIMLQYGDGNAAGGFEVVQDTAREAPPFARVVKGTIVPANESRSLAELAINKLAPAAVLCKPKGADVHYLDVPDSRRTMKISHFVALQLRLGSLMRRTRQVLAVVVVTTALCADHVASAASAAREPVGAIGRVSEVADLASGLAGRFVTRLSRSFGRSVPAIVSVQFRQPRPAVVAAIIGPSDQTATVEPQSFTPFQFRLPPPN
jgi:hypothetical protein